MVALKNYEVRLYNDKNLISVLNFDDTISGMLFGVFGREEGCLVLNCANGSL